MGSGPVIINAETRRRKWSSADADYQVDNTLSCKHMCCREGVDKAPKPPKSFFVSEASLDDPSHLWGHISKLGHVATAKTSAAPSVPGNEQVAEIEIVDLASSQRLRRYEKPPPKAFRSPNHLHENGTKGSTTPVAIKKQPCFGYMKGEQPQIPFLKSSVNAGTSSDNPSTDYDADWMGDLPSPSALLGRPCEKVGSLPEHTSTDDGSSWPDILPSPSALIRQNDAAIGRYTDKNSLEDLDLSQSNDDESEIEAAMVGLSDSVTMQEDSEVQAAAGQTSSQADAYQNSSPPSKESTPKLYHCPTIERKSSGTSKLFFSTDSPEKVAELGQKRKAGVSDQSDQVEDLSEFAPVPKRLRVSDEREQRPIASSSAERQTLSPTATVKPGLPAWVYEFDAGFIAEWQEIVDFV